MVGKHLKRDDRRDGRHQRMGARNGNIVIHHLLRLMVAFGDDAYDARAPRDLKAREGADASAEPKAHAVESHDHDMPMDDADEPAESLYPLLLIVGFLVGSTLLIQTIVPRPTFYGWMMNFMAGFFLSGLFRENPEALPSAFIGQPAPPLTTTA